MKQLTNGWKLEEFPVPEVAASSIYFKACALAYCDYKGIPGYTAIYAAISSFVENTSFSFRQPEEFVRLDFKIVKARGSRTGRHTTFLPLP